MINTYIAAKPVTNVLNLLSALRSGAFLLLLTSCLIIDQFYTGILSSMIRWPLLLTCISMGAVLNLACLYLRHKTLGNAPLLSLFIIDSTLWFLAIAASGGAINPAISYVLILLCVAAFTLPYYLAAFIWVGMSVAYALLMQLSPHPHHAMMVSWHLWGMWVLFVANALIMLWVIVRLMWVIREKELAIAQIKEQIVRDENLLAIGTLASSVAHDLGTPLSTIAVLVDDKIDEDSLLITEQVQRCKQALSQLRNLQQQETKLQTADAFFAQLKQEILLMKPATNIDWFINGHQQLRCSPILHYALLALIHNAIDACKHQVIIYHREKPELRLIDITHDGEAINDELLQKLGQQLLASKKQNGMGMGYYLANASIEQLGGTVTIHNQDGQVLTRVQLPINNQ